MFFRYQNIYIYRHIPILLITFYLSEKNRFILISLEYFFYFRYSIDVNNELNILIKIHCLLTEEEFNTQNVLFIIQY
jgi:hypothetical protein